VVASDKEDDVDVESSASQGPTAAEERQRAIPVSPDGDVDEPWLEFLQIPLRRRSRLMSAEGFYQQFVLVRPANDFRPPHSHDYDAAVHVLRGELLIVRESGALRLVQGETVTIGAGEQHSETCGPNLVILLSGCRERS